MMASPVKFMKLNNICMMYTILLQAVLFSHRSFAQCGLTSVEIINPDGNNQEISLKPFINSNCDKCGTVIATPKSADAMGFRLPGLEFSEYFIVLYPVVLRTAKLLELIEECDRRNVSSDLCGMCDETNNSTFAEKQYSDKQMKRTANAIVSTNCLPYPTGNSKIDQKIAYGMVLVNIGHYDEATTLFNAIIKDYPKAVSAYVGRGTGRLRKGLKNQRKKVMEGAALDFSKAIEKNPENADLYSRKAEALTLLNKRAEAIDMLSEALRLQESSQLYFRRGREHIMTENFENAEQDFRESLRLESDQPEVLYFLGIALHGRGKVRLAIEVFKEVLLFGGNDTDVLVSLANAYRDLGAVHLGYERLRQALKLEPANTLALQLMGIMQLHQGRPAAAAQSFQKCLKVEHQNEYCEYMKGLSLVTLGQLYEGIKSHTKVVVNKEFTAIRLSSEYIRSHYMREYARYLHQHLDSNLTENGIEKDLHPEFSDLWVKLQPYHFQHSYQEQPGLKPSISDVRQPEAWQLQPEVRLLMCRAAALGQAMRPTVDGFINNDRMNVAMGLAALDIGQKMERIWNTTGPGTFPRLNGRRFTWRDLFDIAVSYRRLVNPEHVVVWLDKLPEESFEKGFIHENLFMRGHMENIRFMSYFDLVFKLMKTMIKNFKGDEITNHGLFANEVQNARVVQDLLSIARHHRLNQHGFLITTQVPSLARKGDKHDGVILTLTDTGEASGTRVEFSVASTTTRKRLKSYQAELDVPFSHMIEQLRTKAMPNDKNAPHDISGIILSLVYYFYNLSPLSRGTSAVAYAVTVGLLMSIGREVTGALPPGKLMHFEAMLSGAPDAFVLVTQQWMKMKKSNSTPSALPLVSEHLPTVRHVMEVLNVGVSAC